MDRKHGNGEDGSSISDGTHVSGDEGMSSPNVTASPAQDRGGQRVVQKRIFGKDEDHIDVKDILSLLNTPQFKETMCHCPVADSRSNKFGTVLLLSFNDASKAQVLLKKLVESKTGWVDIAEHIPISKRTNVMMLTGVFMEITMEDLQHVLINDFKLDPELVSVKEHRGAVIKVRGPRDWVRDCLHKKRLRIPSWHVEMKVEYMHRICVIIVVNTTTLRKPVPTHNAA